MEISRTIIDLIGFMPHQGTATLAYLQNQPWNLFQENLDLILAVTGFNIIFSLRLSLSGLRILSEKTHDGYKAEQSY